MPAAGIKAPSIVGLAGAGKGSQMLLGKGSQMMGKGSQLLDSKMRLPGAGGKAGKLGHASAPSSLPGNKSRPKGVSFPPILNNN